MLGVTGLFHRFKSNKGSTTFVIICTTIIIILISALIVDIGYAAVERYSLMKNAEDIASMGAQNLAKNKDSDLGAASADIVKMVKAYAVKKVSGMDNLDIRISDKKTEITIYIGKPFEYMFLGLIGIKGKQMGASATAKISGINSFKGTRPLAVENQKFIFDRQYILSDSLSGDRGTIRFVPLNFGDGGYKTDFMFGYSEPLKMGDSVYALNTDISYATKTSVDYLINKCRHEPLCTYDRYAGDCSRIIVIPVVDKIDSSGKKAMTVLGFTAFFIEGDNTAHSSLTGRFIRYISKSNTSDNATDFGLLGINVLHYN